MMRHPSRVSVFKVTTHLSSSSLCKYIVYLGERCNFQRAFIRAHKYLTARSLQASTPDVQRQDRKMEDRSHETRLGSDPQCWECLRRQLRCDGTRPVCQTCADSGIACPGYEDRQPLRWLAPGRVASRTWGQKKTKKRKNPLTSHPVPDAAAKGDMVPCLSKRVLKVETDDIFEAVKYCQLCNLLS